MIIRAMRHEDLDRITDIWLDTNVKTHYFIPAEYWKSNVGLVKGMLSKAEVYVAEDDQGIQGFIGLNGDDIEGVFVPDGMQSRGIGRLLLDYVKTGRDTLRLHVYRKNTRAIEFYRREAFSIQCEGLDECTGEKDYAMVWQRA